MNDESRSKLTDKLMNSVEGHAKMVWGDLSALVKTEVREAVEDLANLTLLHLQVTDPQLQRAIQMEMTHAKARLANWTFVGADQVRDGVKAALKDLAGLLGAFLKALI